MKKLLFVLFVFLLIFGTACAADQEDFIGKWYSQYGSVEGIKLPTDILGLAYTIEISEDQVILSDGKESFGGTWEQNSESSIILKGSGNDIELTLEDGYLLMQNENTILYFAKSTCSCDCEALQAQIDELTARIAELESGAPAAGTAEEAPASDFEQVVVGDYTVDFVGYKFDKSYDGKDTINITFHYTNNSSESKAYVWAIGLTAFQDGIELKDGYVADSERATEIRPGKSIDIIECFVLRSATEQIELEFDLPISFSDKNKVTRYLDIQ